MAANAGAAGLPAAPAADDGPFPMARLLDLTRMQCPALRLGTNNWDDFERQVRCILLGLSLSDLLTTPDVTGKPLQMLQGFLGVHVEPHLVEVVLAADTTVNLWNALRANSAPSDYSSAYTLLRDLNQIMQQPDEPVAQYISRVRTLHRRLQRTDSPVSEGHAVTALLGGVRSDLLEARTYICRQKLPLTFTVVTEHLVDAESQQREFAKRDTAAATLPSLPTGMVAGVEPDDAEAFLSAAQQGRQARRGSWPPGRRVGRPAYCDGGGPQSPGPWTAGGWSCWVQLQGSRGW